MVKNDHKPHEPSSRFDLNTLPVCGARTRSGGSCRHKGNIRNGRCKRHGGASTGPINQALGKNHHRYVHGLRTKEVIAMRNLVAEMDNSLKGLVQQAE
jgi:hypothetical protein